MRIIKYCQKEHHYSRVSHLQLGTLDYYRNHDNRFIADPREGFGGPYYIEPTDDGKTLSQGFLNDFGAGIFVRGASTNTPIVSIQKGGVVNLNKTFKFVNVYVFCCSIEANPSVNTAKELGYNSWYEIKNPKGFMQEALNLFPEAAQLKYKGPVSTETKLMHGPVEYRDREYQVLDNEFNVLVKLLFTKPKFSEVDQSISFESNNEYRFVWLFINRHNSQIMEVEESPILIRNTKSMMSHFQ